jgi:hypothetical protein
VGEIRIRFDMSDQERNVLIDSLLNDFKPLDEWINDLRNKGYDIIIRVSSPVEDDVGE